MRTPQATGLAATALALALATPEHRANDHYFPLTLGVRF